MSLSWRIILASMDFTAGSRPLRRRSPAAPRPASPSHVRTFLEWPYTLQHYTSQTWPHLLVGLIQGFRAQSRKYAAPPPIASSATTSITFSCPHIPGMALHAAALHITDMAAPPCGIDSRLSRSEQEVGRPAPDRQQRRDQDEPLMPAHSLSGFTSRKRTHHGHGRTSLWIDSRLAPRAGTRQDCPNLAIARMCPSTETRRGDVV